MDGAWLLWLTDLPDIGEAYNHDRRRGQLPAMTDDRQRDGELVRRFVGGEARAFDELMRRHEDRVFAVCLRVMGDRELALDATQETFVTVYRKAHSTTKSGLQHLVVPGGGEHLLRPASAACQAAHRGDPRRHGTVRPVLG